MFDDLPRVLHYEILDEQGGVVEVLRPSRGSCNPYEPNDKCGGCDSCLLDQAEDAGYKIHPVLRPTLWTELLGDGWPRSQDPLPRGEIIKSSLKEVFSDLREAMLRHPTAFVQSACADRIMQVVFEVATPEIRRPIMIRTVPVIRLKHETLDSGTRHLMLTERGRGLLADFMREERDRVLKNRPRPTRWWCIAEDDDDF